MYYLNQSTCYFNPQWYKGSLTLNNKLLQNKVIFFFLLFIIIVKFTVCDIIVISHNIYQNLMNLCVRWQLDFLIKYYLNTISTNQTKIVSPMKILKNQIVNPKKINNHQSERALFTPLLQSPKSININTTTKFVMPNSYAVLT